MTINVILNGNEKDLEINPSETLLDVLRRNSLIMQKKGCGKGSCGCCTVLLNDKPVASCKVPAVLVQNCEIITLDFFKKTQEYSDIIKGYKKAGIDLCGYCNSGKIFMTYQIMKMQKIPEKKEITSLLKNLSPCCTDLETLVTGVLYTLSIRKNNRQN